MGSHAAITVGRPPDELRELWQREDLRSGFLAESEATVTFRRAPGDRGTEIHVELPEAGLLSGAVQKVTGAAPLAKAKDELRRFKQRVETGTIVRSEGTPEGELAERKLKQRPAQPLEADELEKAGV